MTLGRTMRSVRGEKYSIIRVNWLTKLFVIGDVFSFLVQSSGGGLMAQGSGQHMGKTLIIVGLLLQITMFGLFVVTTIIWHVRMGRHPTGEPYNRNITWKQTVFMLYGVSMLIMIRSVFRVIEYVMGNDGYLLQHEWTLYVFDAVLMFLVMVIFFIWYPSKVKPSGQAVDLESVTTKH